MGKAQIYPGVHPFIRRIFQRQAQLGLLDKELAHLSGYSAPYISALRNGHRKNASIYTITDLAAAVGLTLSIQEFPNAQD